MMIEVGASAGNGSGMEDESLEPARVTGARLPLRTLLAGPAEAQGLVREAAGLPVWSLEERQLSDLELLLNGGFHPLDGYLREQDYRSVCRRMRLADGRLWPIPIMLDVTVEFAFSLGPRSRVVLRHPEGVLLAILTVESLWAPDRASEARAVLGTDDPAHPGAARLLNGTHRVYLGGRVEGIALPPHHSFGPLRHTPEEIRSVFAERGWTRVVAFQTRNPLHRAHLEVIQRAAARADAKVLIHPAVGPTHPDDVDAITRVRCYQAVLPQLLPGAAMLSLLPLEMRLAGPREALLHALVRANYGCTHFIVGRDHAGAGRNAKGHPFYDPDAARELAMHHQAELGIEIVPSEEVVYVPHLDRHMPVSEIPRGAGTLTLSGTEMRRRLRTGEEIPEWFSAPAVIEELRRRHPPRDRQGFTVFFTGLSGAGKSTIAAALAERLMEIGPRSVTLLDGDLVRKNLSSGLGFSHADRDANIRRIAFVALEITKCGGIALCAPIAPYRAVRRAAREEISRVGGFIEVHVATPVETCEARDRKGLYAKARAGLIQNFTGVNDPYEVPESAELTIDASTASPSEGVGLILQHLRENGYLPGLEDEPLQRVAFSKSAISRAATVPIVPVSLKCS